MRIKKPVRYRKISYFTVLVAAFCALVILHKSEAGAEGLSWSAQIPTVVSVEPTLSTLIESDACRTNLQSVETGFGSVINKVCVTSGDSLRFGLYYASASWNTLVGFGHDKKMYRLASFGCKGYNDCLYLPDTDTLVMKKFIINNLVQSLAVYKNVKQRLIPTVASDGFTREYRFNADSPDYVFQRDDTGYAWPVGGIGASNNGRWIAVEFRGKGIGVLDMKTLIMKRISALSLNYTGGYKPTVEITVTEDGGHIAMSGRNVSGPAVYEITDSCGDFPKDDPDGFSNKKPLAKTCPTSPIYPSSFIYRPKDSYTPRFSDDGRYLKFYINSYDAATPNMAVELRASGDSDPRLDYLALGDSFSSGEGETSDSYYQKGTNDLHEKCHTSSRSYPYIAAELLGISRDYVKNVACSGATTADITGGDELYTGQGGRLGGSGLKFTDAEKVSAQSLALETFIPGRVRQASFVRQYQPKSITIGIGGNDVGFMQKLKACLSPGTCSWVNTPEGKEKTALEIKSKFDTFVRTYQSLISASPTSKIYVIGYPKIIDEDGSCDILTGSLLSKDEKRFMNEGVLYLNQVIAAAARTAGVQYVDAWEVYGDKVLCGKDTPSAFNAIRIGDDHSPIDAWARLKIIGQESFHPKPLGHDLLGRVVVASMASSAAISPQPTPAPEPSPYWLPNGYSSDLPSQHYIEYAYRDKSRLSVNIGDYALAPRSVARLEVHSEPVVLGEFAVNDQGGLANEVVLPSDLEEGYHTLHLYGVSYSGEEVDLYQVIAYGEEKESELSPAAKAPQGKSLAHSIPLAAESSSPQHEISYRANSTPAIKGVATIASSLVSDNTPDIASLDKTDIPQVKMNLLLIGGGIIIALLIVSFAVAKLASR